MMTEVGNQRFHKILNEVLDMLKRQQGIHLAST